ncbi:MAG: hypothetical protein K2X27_22685, partial [Candidatus Obscuribacterales bacterium]|nr:hypothetical protein [Candidatus Obscuribacterales bacterium]
MSDVKARVTTSQGQTIGYFVNPEVKNLCEKDYEISGVLVDETGRPYEKVEFNPEVLAYIIDVSAVPGLAFKTLEKAYVQRGRQPVRMTAVGPL